MGSKLFVGGLSWGVDDHGLKEAFSPFGNVVEAKVITDRESGRSKGFGFVKYDNEESAHDAKAENVVHHEERVVVRMTPADAEVAEDHVGLIGVALDEDRLRPRGGRRRKEGWGPWPISSKTPRQVSCSTLQTCRSRSA